ncbi:MAG TPA: Gfo/Idh/MocA family oxidoreductase [Gemmatimonadales bacterium]|nr:Gfo/Idh/MocA family oxidoreductase [Gemmatimonadales bacterium]
MVEASAGSGVERPLRLGMVGGGRGAFIGGVHRLCARMDGQYDLVAGALSSDPQRAKESGADLRLAPDRVYASFAEMAAAEAKRSDGIEVVSIVTPNDSHHAIARAFLDRGIDVICDKPMTTTVEDALDLVQTVKRTRLVFGVTHNYTGYPMVRQAREMIAAGELGTIRIVHVEYVQDWLTTKLEDTGQKQAAWRVDPARAGVGGCLGDIGTHAYNLAGFVTGLAVRELAADVSRLVPGRRLDDNVHMLLRFENGARGILWSSQVAPGNENGLRLRVYGEKAGLEWSQEHPNQLRSSPVGQPPRVLSRGGPSLGPAASRATRIPSGHPEGYLEGFANLYRDLAEQIRARRAKRAPDKAALLVPTVEDGAHGVKFIHAAVESSAKNGAWVNLKLELAD